MAAFTLLTQDQALAILEEFLARNSSEKRAHVDRPEIVAHATLSAWVHHWPSRVKPGVAEVLAATPEIRALENSRWMTQRRIAIAKIARVLG